MVRVLSMVVAAAVASQAAAQSCESTVTLTTATNLLQIISKLNNDVTGLKGTVGTLAGQATAVTNARDTKLAALERGLGKFADPVKWVAQGCTTSAADGTIVKTGCGNGWNGGAISSRLAPGDVELTFKCTRAQHTMIGLAQGNSHNSYQDIECAMYCDQGNLKIYESGRYKGVVGTYQEYQTLSVKRVGTKVTFNQAGAELQTCTKKLQGDVIADISIHNKGRGGVLSAAWIGEVVVPYTASVVWKNSACTKIAASGQIMKSGCGNGWNGGAISTRSAAGDITLRFTCSTSQYSMIGLSVGDSHKSYQDIDCALYCQKGNFLIYERGSYKGRKSNYNTMSRLEVRRLNNVVSYWKDSKKYATCQGGKKLVGSVLADISIHNNGAGGILTAEWVGTIGKTKVQDVTWKALKCVKQSANGGLYKSGCGNGWNAGAISSKSASGDIALEFRCDTTQHSMLGFSVGNSHNSYTDIDCAIYCNKGNMRIYERGRGKANIGKLTQYDTLKLKRTGTTVTYHKNGLNVGTCGIQLKGKVLADISLYLSGRMAFNAAKWLGDVA